MDLVDELVFALHGDARLSCIRLVGTDVVLVQGGKHGFHSRLDFSRIVAGAVAGQQEFQHEGGYVGAPLDPVQQILAHHFAAEDLVQLPVEIVENHVRRP